MSAIETYKFIADERELKWFYKYCIPPLDRDSVYFLSLSARNKKLSEDEREYFKVSRSEMFAKTIIRKDEWRYFIEHIKRLECNKNGYKTKTDLPYPDKCLVLYWNLNPSSVRKCIRDTQHLVLDLEDELVNAALKNSAPAVDSAFHKMRKAFDSIVSLYARNISDKHWLDFDIDMDKFDPGVNNKMVLALHKRLLEKLGKANFAMLKSSGGWHIMVKKSAVKFNPEEICTLIKSVLSDCQAPFTEVIKNDNMMTALPGSWMYGNFMPFIYNKDDFTEADALHPDVNLSV